MNPDDLAKILDELERRLGPAGQHVFELAVRQVYIDAITAVVLLVAFSGATAIAAPRLYRWIAADERYGDRPIVGMLVGIPWVIVGALIGVMAVACIPAVLNPEYAAISKILGAVR